MELWNIMAAVSSKVLPHEEEDLAQFEKMPHREAAPIYQEQNLAESNKETWSKHFERAI